MLQGRIPDWAWSNWRFSLEYLNLSHNLITNMDSIPLHFVDTIDLLSNFLKGLLPIPQSLINCKQLEVLDVGDNHLNDTFPLWLGTQPMLKVLSMRSNKLHGSIRNLTTENMFPQLLILALSYNGFEREIVRILFLYTTVNLSNNKFEGSVPSILGDLVALCMLNLSHNELQGHIPLSLGNLSIVESLDLSGNHLIGEIPTQFVSFTYLEVLNLPHNHLKGIVPQGNQFHAFENNSYEGNDGLYGFPLSKGYVNDCIWTRRSSKQF
ncbi:hypothetical protein P3S68_024466 [Capsicum galapagoense]